MMAWLTQIDDPVTHTNEDTTTDDVTRPAARSILVVGQARGHHVEAVSLAGVGVVSSVRAAVDCHRDFRAGEECIVHRLPRVAVFLAAVIQVALVI
mgnify:CR=1 FL=1